MQTAPEVSVNYAASSLQDNSYQVAKTNIRKSFGKPNVAKTSHDDIRRVMSANVDKKVTRRPLVPEYMLPDGKKDKDLTCQVFIN